MSKIGLQLYSVKELSKVDFLGTVKKVAEIGYDGIEFAGFFDTPAKDLKKVLDSSGIEVCGSHSGIDILKNDLDNHIQYNLEIGNPYIICPGLPGDMSNSEEAWKQTAELFNEIGAKCKENNIQFGYHNHSFEFEKYNGKYGYDILAENTQADLVCLEIDTFWVEHAGLKSVDFMNKYPDRLPLLHIKEMKSLTEKKNTEVGKGIMDFKKIVNLGKKYGTKWFIVEQEYFEIDQLQSIEDSLTYLRSIV